MTNSKMKDSVEFKIIVKEIINNPQNGLITFKEKYTKCIKSAVFKIAHSYILVDEVLNDVLIKMWKRCYYIKDVKSPYSWIHVVTCNIVKDKLKTKKSYEELNENISSEHNVLENFIEDNSFYGRIACLPDLEQDIMILKIMWRYTFEEISIDLNKPLTTVSSAYYRALKKLKNKKI